MMRPTREEGAAHRERTSIKIPFLLAAVAVCGKPHSQGAGCGVRFDLRSPPGIPITEIRLDIRDKDIVELGYAYV